MTKVSGKNRVVDHEANGHEAHAPVATMKPVIMCFDIIGTSPLLQNNPANFIGVVDGGGLVGGKKKYNDEEEARLRLYLTPDGEHYHPYEAFKKAMFKAVKGKKYGKITATTAINGAVFIVEPYSLILDGNGQPISKYSIDRRPAVIGTARILRCRPCWGEWRMKVAFEVDTAMLVRSHVFDALSLAGRIIGIGDYRPEKGGGFGRFRVE